MIQVRDWLERLTLDVTELREAMLSRPVDPAPYLRQLDKTVQVLEAKSEKVSSPKPPLDAEEVWAHWRVANYDLTKLDAREVRTLCVSPKTAMKARLIGALTTYPDALKRWINFNGFVQAYFAQWRTMDEPQTVERLIRNMLGNGRILRSSKNLDLWRRSPFLFSTEASRRIGEVIIRERKSVKQCCAEYCIESTSALAIAAHEQATNVAVAELIQRDVRVGQETALKELQWISANLLTTVLSSDAYRQGMSKLIVSRLAEGMPLFQSALVSLVHADERLGDPRLAYCAPNWRTVLPEAREKFLAWLAKDTLQFFFDTLVPRNDRNRRRAEFWLEYAKKQGKIKDFQVAVSEDDRPKIRASRAKTIPSYSTISGGKASAFLMVFEGYGTNYVVIEFSETGHAAYIYALNVFEASGATMHSNSFDMSEDLKRMDDAEDRILHPVDTRERWETKARRKLAELGIRP
jgi:EH_Signature domain